MFMAMCVFVMITHLQQCKISVYGCVFVDRQFCRLRSVIQLMRMCLRTMTYHRKMSKRFVVDVVVVHNIAFSSLALLIGLQRGYPAFKTCSTPYIPKVCFWDSRLYLVCPVGVRGNPPLSLHFPISPTFYSVF